ncbi:MAG: hypothetical protein U0271_48360 [Polyangiaceae bacterium]
MASTWTTPSSSVLPRAPTDARAETQRTRAGRIGRAVLLAIGATLAVGASMREPRVKATDRNQAVVEILKTRGFTVDEPGDVVFVDPPKGLLGAAFGRSRVLVRARAVPKDPLLGEQLTDIYLFEAKLTPSGALVDLEGGYNLSDTTGAEETRPLVHGEQIAFASLSGIQGAPSIVTILDFNGQTVPSTFSASDRIKNGVTNLQATGRYRGLSRRTFVVGFDTTRIDPKTGLPIPGSEDAAAEDAAAGPTPDPADMELSLDGDHVVVAFANEHARLPFTGALPKEDALPKWLHYDPFELAPPGNLVTWSVDRVRLEIGDENMQAIKEKFFDMKDFVDRNREEMTGATGEDEIAEDLGEALGTPKREIPVDPDMGWPPPPLEPWVTPALPGEGKWNAKDDAAFYNNQPNLPPTFLTTFIRSDRTRKVTRAYIVLWDPRQVELHMMAGTVEPKGATGKAGPGLIPRTPDIMKRLVAATNAGFQALHGEFGMMADGVVYLPPKPYAATVMSSAMDRPRSERGPTTRTSTRSSPIART